MTQGLLIRRSRVRVPAGPQETAGISGSASSGQSAVSPGAPYNGDTAKSPLPGAQASQFPKAEQGGGPAARCAAEPTVDLRKGKLPGSAPCARQGGDESASHPTPALITAEVARHAGLSPMLLAEAMRDVMQRRAGR